MSNTSNIASSQAVGNLSPPQASVSADVSPAELGSLAAQALPAPQPSAATVAPFALDLERSFFRDTTRADKQISDSGIGSGITLGDGNNRVTLRGIGAQVTAGDGHNTIDSTDILPIVTLGHGHNRYTGTARTLTLGNGNNIVSGDFEYVRVGDGNNQITGSFTALSIGNGNNSIRVTGRLRMCMSISFTQCAITSASRGASSLTTGSGSNTVDVHGAAGGGLALYLNGGDVRVIDPPSNLTVQFSAGSTPENINLERFGNDLVATVARSKEKLTVHGAFGKLASILTLRTGDAQHSCIVPPHFPAVLPFWRRSGLSLL